MTRNAFIPAPTAEDDAELFRHAFRRVVEINLAVLEKFGDDALAPPPDEHPAATPAQQAAINGQHARACAAVSNAIRHAILAAHKLAQPGKATAPEPPPPDPRHHARVQVMLDMDHAIRHAVRDTRGQEADRPDIGRLQAEVLDQVERLGDLELDTSPVASIVARLCAELGLAVPAEPRYVPPPPKTSRRANGKPKTLSQMTDEELADAELKGTLPDPTEKELAEYAAMEAYREERKHNPPVGCVGHWHPNPPPGRR